MNYKLLRSDVEIDTALNQAWDYIDGGSRYPAMTYEEGVIAVLAWLFEDTDPPFED